MSSSRVCWQNEGWTLLLTPLLSFTVSLYIPLHSPSPPKRQAGQAPRPPTGSARLASLHSTCTGRFIPNASLIPTNPERPQQPHAEHRGQMNATLMTEEGPRGVPQGSDLTPEELGRLEHVQAFRQLHQEALSGEDRRRRRRRRTGEEGEERVEYLSEMPAQDEVGIIVGACVGVWCSCLTLASHPPSVPLSGPPSLPPP